MLNSNQPPAVPEKSWNFL